MFDVHTSRLSYDLRSSGMNLIVPKARTNFFRNGFASAGAKLWNSLPSSLKEETSLKQFKAKIRSGICYLHKPTNLSFLSLSLTLCTTYDLYCVLRLSCVVLCGPRADLWPFYGFLCDKGRFPSVDQSSRFAGVPNLGKPLYREKTVYIKTHKTAINRPVDYTGET